MGSKTSNFDPLAYIENAFLDKSPKKDKQIVSASDGIDGLIQDHPSNGVAGNNGESLRRSGKGESAKFRKTEMSAPRPRRAREPKPKVLFVNSSMQSLWDTLPRNLEFLFSFYDDSVTANYYRGEFKESRHELARRLIDPELSLEETSRLLGVCPATVRRYTNRGWIEHHRTKGGQRRFYLSGLVKFVENHGRFPEG